MQNKKLPSSNYTYASAFTNSPACQMRQVFAEGLGAKWALPILKLINVRQYQFGELQRSLPGISRKVLSQTLRSLLAGEFALRCHTAKGKVIMSNYQITDSGRGLLVALQPLEDWSVDYVSSHRTFSSKENTPTPVKLERL